MGKNDGVRLKSFWIPEVLFKQCSTGVSVSTLDVDISKRINDHDYFINELLPEIRGKIAPYENRQRMPKSEVKRVGVNFRNLINDAIDCLEEGNVGYLFTAEQVVEFLRFVPDARVEYKDGIFFIRRDNKNNEVR